MINYIYGFKISETKGIFVYETEDNWLSIADDPSGRLFFSFKDIEEYFNIKLTLRKTKEIKPKILH